MHVRPAIGGLLLVVAAATSMATGAHGQAQSLTLADALAIAERMAYANRQARGDARATAGAVTAALGGLLPALRVGAGWTRTTDPLAAFGLKLQQRVVTAADFDPAQLDRPAALSSYGASAVLEQPILNLDALAARQVASVSHDAARATVRSTGEAVARDVVHAYYRAVLATARLAALDSADLAAWAHVRQATAALRNGMVTRSDVLLAQVRAGDLDAQLFAAAADTGLARQRLGLAIGMAPGERGPALVTALPDDDHLLATATALSDTALASPRADVAAANLVADAAHAEHTRARATFLPRIASFARLDWASPLRPLAGVSSWTAGVAVTWTPFEGGQLGGLEASAGRESAARAAAAAAAARAALDRQQSASALAVAVARLPIARRNDEQAAEALRIVTRKYSGGTASIAELLDAAAAATQARLALTEARTSLIFAIADRRYALGLSIAPMATLDAPSVR